MNNDGCSFTFWSNMRDTLDKWNDDPEMKLKLYDAITDYGLYGIEPEEDGTEESRSIAGVVQALSLSLDKSRNYEKIQQELSQKGGAKEKFSEEEIFNAVRQATKIKNGVPSRKEVIEEFKKMYKQTISTRTISRRCPDDKKKSIAEEVLNEK